MTEATDTSACDALIHMVFTLDKWGGASSSAQDFFFHSSVLTNERLGVM